MKLPLRILHIEDSVKDSDLIREILEREGLTCEIVRVEKRPEVFEALENRPFDMILSDCNLPQFSGLQALEIAHALKPEVPFIFVSGTIGEDTAIESLRNGATDYVLKDRLSRLGAAVRRAIAEAEEHALYRQLQRRLHEAGRLEAISTLSQGIAHDFNNILTIILGHASLLKMEYDRPKRVLEITNVITQAARRASDVVEQLLAFAHEGENRARPINLNLSVTNTLRSLEPGFPAHVSISFESDDTLPEILADPHQLERMITNLVSNALDSMPQGGEIQLSTKVVPSDQVPEALAPLTSETYARLQVTDTGMGMDSATREHIFEPFYTTKVRGRGTGLGLPVVYGLMQAHHGRIDVKSEPDQGTTVSLYFPLPRQQIAADPSVPVARLSDPDLVGTQTVLVIEDEIEIGDFLQTVLQSHGYRVLLARDAEEALCLFNTHEEEIQILFSDISLPKMDGITLCAKLKALKPELQVIMASGFSPKEFKTRFEELGVEAFVPKPYNPHDILWCMKRVLSGDSKMLNVA